MIPLQKKGIQNGYSYYHYPKGTSYANDNRTKLTPHDEDGKKWINLPSTGGDVHIYRAEKKGYYYEAEFSTT